MTANEFYNAVLTPGLAFIRKSIPHIPASTEEQVMLMAIAGQESNWTDRRQAHNGPASSFWQFERTGILGLMRDDETSKWVAVICGLSGVALQSTAIWRFMGTPEGDTFSCAMGRLLLWTDPMRLPKNEQDAWLGYYRLWRPGAPDRARWAVRYPEAVAAVQHGAKV